MIKSLLCIFWVLKANEAKLFGFAVCIPHDTGRDQLTELSETTLQQLLSEIWLREILDVEVGGASRFCRASSVQLRHILTD